MTETSHRRRQADADIEEPRARDAPTATCSRRARSPPTTSRACSTSSTTTATSTRWSRPAARSSRSSATGCTTLVGQRGATLEALQELTRLAIFRQTGSPCRLLLDVGGYRDARRKELVAIAKNAAERVKQHGEPVRLEPMSAFERKCVHDVINAMTGVESESEGVEPHRRIVVHPA